MSRGNRAMSFATGCVLLAIASAAPAAAENPAPLPPLPPVHDAAPGVPDKRASGMTESSEICADLHRVIAALPNDLVAIRGQSLNLSEKEPDDIWRATVTPPGFSNCVVMALGGDWLAGYSCDDSSIGPGGAVPYKAALDMIASCLDVSWGGRFTREDHAWVYEFYHVNGPTHVYLRVNPADGAKALDIYSDGTRRAAP
ncbi:hypothetical protein sos41_32660 [Alphaproteobacteria bacterium SO-S41]|nr:hypothetical protein sos41_32660 [Alphaproteobacteria bacterium SO-S41]